jgi:hypothetical protein
MPAEQVQVQDRDGTVLGYGIMMDPQPDLAPFKDSEDATLTGTHTLPCMDSTSMDVHVHTHNLRINLPHTLSLFTCADEQIKAGGYVRVKLTGLVHAYRLFTLPFDHVFDDGYDCVQDTQMSELLLLCTINAKSSIFVWHEYIAPREIKSARTMGGNTPPAKRRKS